MWRSGLSRIRFVVIHWYQSEARSSHSAAGMVGQPHVDLEAGDGGAEREALGERALRGERRVVGLGGVFRCAAARRGSGGERQRQRAPGTAKRQAYDSLEAHMRPHCVPMNSLMNLGPVSREPVNPTGLPGSLDPQARFDESPRARPAQER